MSRWGRRRKEGNSGTRNQGGRSVGVIKGARVCGGTRLTWFAFKKSPQKRDKCGGQVQTISVVSRCFTGFRTGPTHIHSVGKVKKICSVVGHYYSALPKVRVHFYVLVRPRSHPAVLHRRGGRHDSRHRPAALCFYSSRQSMQNTHSQTAH